MLIRRIQIRRWDILLFLSFDIYDKGCIQNALFWAQAPDSIKSRVSESISAGRLNEGFCYSNPNIERTVIGVGETDTGPEFLNTTVHEIVHAAQDIAHTRKIDPYGEDFAYLVGEICREISDVVCEMSCPHCRCE